MVGFAENVKKKTDGAILINCYGAGQLGSESSQVSGLQTGMYVLYPHFNVLDLAFLFPSTDTAEKMLDGPVGARLLNELPARGSNGLSYGWWASKRSFDTLDKQHQEANRQAKQELTPSWRRMVGEASDRAAKEIASKGGVKLIPAEQVDRAAYREAVERVYKQYRNIVGTDLMDAVLKAAA
jgi:TRAP-type C4-dicarboxylate transport system substrate-binding protein